MQQYTIGERGGPIGAPPDGRLESLRPAPALVPESQQSGPPFMPFVHCRVAA